MCHHPAERVISMGGCFAALDSIEATLRDGPSPVRDHIIPWSTPRGSGTTGLPLYWHAGRQGWSHSPNEPHPNAHLYPTVAAYLRTYWRADRALRQLLDARLPTDYVARCEYPGCTEILRSPLAGWWAGLCPLHNTSSHPNPLAEVRS